MSNTNANNNKDEDDQEKEDLENMGAFQCDDDAGYTNVGSVGIVCALKSPDSI